ncbi:MAG: 4Fe-4S dicluster domain-containing protein [Holophagaceae bacterium]|nr:4Fe-4S dicluster domain-containing protein [Holophagaceae bacterium]
MTSKLEQPQDRSSFFKAIGTLFAGFMAERVEETLEGMGPKLLRPPGAISELAFLTACTRCDKCIDACPQGSLRRAPPSAGLAMGTPQLVPRELPCFLCESLPCIGACEENALLQPKLTTEQGTEIMGPEAVRIGIAHIKPSRCLAFETLNRPAEPCRACVDRCPYPGVAIKLAADEYSPIQKPEVIPSMCTGCGMCEFGCPAPRPGIIVRHRM